MFQFMTKNGSMRAEECQIIEPKGCLSEVGEI